jgi:hypothetical protein
MDGIRIALSGGEKPENRRNAGGAAVGVMKIAISKSNSQLLKGISKSFPAHFVPPL